MKKIAKVLLGGGIMILSFFSCSSEDSIDEQSLISDESLVGENSSTSLLTTDFYNITSHENGLNLSNRNHREGEVVLSLETTAYAGRSEQIWEIELGTYSGASYTWCYIKNRASDLYLRANSCPGSESSTCEIIQSSTGVQWSVYDSDLENVKIVNANTGYYLKVDGNGDLTLSDDDEGDDVTFTFTAR